MLSLVRRKSGLTGSTGGGRETLQALVGDLASRRLFVGEIALEELFQARPGPAERDVHAPGAHLEHPGDLARAQVGAVAQRDQLTI